MLTYKITQTHTQSKTETKLVFITVIKSKYKLVNVNKKKE